MASGNQHAIRMRHIVICGLPGSAVFSASHKLHDFRKKKKKVIGHKMCVLIFSATMRETFLFQEELSEMLSKMCIDVV